VAGRKADAGISPAAAAARALEAGIAVSVVALAGHEGNYNKDIIEEMERTAAAGGGLFCRSNAGQLARDLQLMAVQTARRVVEQMVNRQLRSIMGEDVEKLEPRSKLKISDFIGKYGGNINIKCIIVLDTGSIIGDKPEIVLHSVTKLMESLRDRRGSSELAVIAYPADHGDKCNVICDFTGDIGILNKRLKSIPRGNGAPMGAAIMKACMLMYDYYSEEKGAGNQNCFC